MADGYHDMREGGAYATIQMALAGLPVADVLQILCDCLAGVVAIACAEVGEADEFINLLPDDLKRYVRDNWAETRQYRAQMLGGAGKMDVPN